MTGKHPNLFVVGAPKAGTSSLYQYLGQHSDIFIPEIKELHHFSYPEVADTYYQVEFVQSRDAYLALYEKAATVRWAGDFSPSYLANPAAAERISKHNPDSRIIIVLRNPVDRTISHYLMDRRLGLQQRPLAECILNTPENKLFYKEYIRVSQYSSQIGSYLKHFNADQIHIGLYDDLVRDPNDFVRRILEFLDLDTSVHIDMSRKHNPFRLPRTPVLGRMYRSRLKKSLGRLLPGGVKKYMRGLLFSSNKPDMSEEMKFLKPVFIQDINEVEAMTGLDLSGWK